MCVIFNVVPLLIPKFTFNILVDFFQNLFTFSNNLY